MASLVETVQAKAEAKAASTSPSVFLLGAQATIVGIFAALQITGDLFSRMVANHPVWTGAAILFGVLAASMSIVAAIFGSWFTKGFLIAGVTFFLIGASCAIVAGTLAYSDRGKPIVTITSAGATGTLEATVRLSNLKTRETISVRVEALRVEQKPGGGVSYMSVPGIPIILETAFGPDSKGDVNRTISVELPPGDYHFVGVRAWIGELEDCFSEASATTSCETRRVARPSTRPQLVTRLLEGESGKRLRIRVTDSGLGIESFVFLRVRSSGGVRRDLLQWTMAPANDGSFARTLNVRIRGGYSRICVEASTSMMPAGTCRGSQLDTSWVKLAVA